MKVRIINTFNDKYTHERCTTGSIKEYPNERAEELIKTGYAVAMPKKTANEDEE